MQRAGRNSGRWPGACCALASLRHHQDCAGDRWHPWACRERSLLLPSLTWAHFWGANCPPDEKDEGLMNLYCVWRLFLGHGWRRGRSWAAPLNYRWGRHHWPSGIHVSLSVFCLWLRKKPNPVYKRDAVRDFYQKITIFLGMIHYLKLANICVIKYWWCWGGVIKVWDRALSSHLSWLLFLWLCESSLAFHLVFLPVEGRWVCVNNWECQLMNILTKNNYYL